MPRLSFSRASEPSAAGAASSAEAAEDNPFILDLRRALQALLRRAAQEHALTENADEVDAFCGCLEAVVAHKFKTRQFYMFTVHPWSLIEHSEACGASEAEAVRLARAVGSSDAARMRAWIFVQLNQRRCAREPAWLCASQRTTSVVLRPKLCPALRHRHPTHAHAHTPFLAAATAGGAAAPTMCPAARPRFTLLTAASATLAACSQRFARCSTTTRCATPSFTTHRSSTLPSAAICCWTCCDRSPVSPFGSGRRLASRRSQSSPIRISSPARRRPPCRRRRRLLRPRRRRVLQRRGGGDGEGAEGGAGGGGGDGGGGGRRSGPGRERARFTSAVRTYRVYRVYRVCQVGECLRRVCGRRSQSLQRRIRRDQRDRRCGGGKGGGRCRDDSASSASAGWPVN